MVTLLHNEVKLLEVGVSGRIFKMVNFLAFVQLILISIAWANQGHEGDCTSLESEPQNIKEMSQFSQSIYNKALRSQSDIHLESSLILPWDQTPDLPCPPPFKAVFHAKGKTLEFLAVRHIQGEVDLSDPELELIKSEVTRLHPDHVLTEFKSPVAGNKTISA